MKIIFDSEEQKMRFMNGLAYFCPEELGLTNMVSEDEDCIMACKVCWDHAIETEVKDENNI